MEGFEEKLNELMNNPNLMQQIMSMAQSLGQSSVEAPKQEAPSAPALPEISPDMLQGILKFSSQSRLDSRETTLLRALQPYLTQHRIQKLEKAMRAAKLAGLAQSILGSGGGLPLLGR